MAKTKTKRRSCEGKRPNATEEAARQQLTALVRNRGAIWGQYRIYRCEHCNAWHIGHKGRS